MLLLSASLLSLHLLILVRDALLGAYRSVLGPSILFISH